MAEDKFGDNLKKLLELGRKERTSGNDFVRNRLYQTALDRHILQIHNDGLLVEKIKTTMQTAGSKNNSNEWKSTFNYDDVPNLLRPQLDIDADRKAVMQLFKEESKGSDCIPTVTHVTKAQVAHVDIPSTSTPKSNPYDIFMTANDAVENERIKKLGTTYNTCKMPEKPASSVQTKSLQQRKSLKFIPPFRCNVKPETEKEKTPEPEDERLKGMDAKLIEMIKSEIMDTGPSVDWEDIAGLQSAKTAIREVVVWPLLRPDIFTGLRRPPKGILLFGPPGTGKTLIGRCVASQSKSTFFSISASSLTSKWVGEGEKLVRALFAVARCHQPAVVFMDEIDSLLSQRSESEHESSRRMKTEFLIQLDGARTDAEERLLIIGATNRPQELDEAARRRFVKRLYIPLPEQDGRLQLLQKLMAKEKHSLTSEQFDEIALAADGYSGADIKSLCSDACLGPIRSIDFAMMVTIQPSEVRPVDIADFRKSLARVKSSVAQKDLQQYMEWDNTYGSGLCQN